MFGINDMYLVIITVGVMIGIRFIGEMMGWDLKWGEQK
jgi:hypothetical protein